MARAANPPRSPSSDPRWRNGRRMYAWVAPMRRHNSISSRCVRICRRMVLKVTATRAIPSNPDSSRTPVRPSRSSASRRFTHAESACTWVTLGNDLNSASSLSAVTGSLAARVITKASGRGFWGRLAMTSFSPPLRPRSASAASREMKRTARTPRAPLRRASSAATSALDVSFARNRSEEHTSELQSHRDLHSFPTRRSSDLCRLARDEAHGAHSARSPEAGLERGDVGFGRLLREEHRELRLEADLVRQRLEIREEAVHPERQRERDPDRDDVEQGRERRPAQPGGGLRQAQAVVLEPRPHCSFP